MVLPPLALLQRPPFRRKLFTISGLRPVDEFPDVLFPGPENPGAQSVGQPLGPHPLVPLERAPGRKHVDPEPLPFPGLELSVVHRPVPVKFFSGSGFLSVDPVALVVIRQRVRLVLVDREPLAKAVLEGPLEDLPVLPDVLALAGDLTRLPLALIPEY